MLLFRVLNKHIIYSVLNPVEIEYSKVALLYLFQLGLHHKWPGVYCCLQRTVKLCGIYYNSINKDTLLSHAVVFTLLNFAVYSGLFSQFFMYC